MHYNALEPGFIRANKNNSSQIKLLMIAKKQFYIGDGQVISLLNQQLKSYTESTYSLKENAAYFNKKNYIMDGNDSFSEYNKIPLGHNRTNGAVYSKIYFKVQICSAL